MRTKFPKIHQFHMSCGFSAESGGIVRNATIFPILWHSDEAGTVTTVFTNPQHASFAEVAHGLCHTDSTIGRMRVKLTFFTALETFAPIINETYDGGNTDAQAEMVKSGERLTAIQIKYMPIISAFSEDMAAKDEKSGLTVGTTLEMQTDATERVAFPLFNNTKMYNPTTFGGSLNQFLEGHDTDNSVEAVTFIQENYYDMLQYGMIRGLIRKITPGGMKVITLSRNKPFKTVFMKFTPSAVKRINPYTFCGILVHLVQAQSTAESGGLSEQPFFSSDTTATPHVYCRFDVEFEEWNKGFQHEIV